MHRNHRTISLPRGASFRRCVDLFEESFQKGDGAILPIFQAFPRNDNFPIVLAKCALLNALYSTQVLSLTRMAEHIHRLNIDERLKLGDFTLVDAIRRGHGIKAKSGEDRDFLSFASKYCSFHALDVYPIFDNIVADLIHAALIRPGLIEPNVSRQDLRNYDRYHAAICATREWLEVPTMTFKEVDKGLWLLAKFFYRPKQLTPDVRDAVSRCVSGE